MFCPDGTYTNDNVLLYPFGVLNSLYYLFAGCLPNSRRVIDTMSLPVMTKKNNEKFSNVMWMET